MASNKNPQPDKTRLDKDVSSPSTTAPGDGPADTTDPTEEATSVTPDKAAAAEGGNLTVNAVLPVERPEAPAAKRGKDRIEKYERARPNGDLVTVEHNIDTGETKVV